MRKSNLDLLLPEIWPKLSIKASKRQKNSCFAEIVHLSSFISKSAARDEK